MGTQGRANAFTSTADILNPAQEMRFQPGPGQSHTNIKTTGVCLPTLQVVVDSCLLLKHSNWVPVGVGGREWKGRSIRYLALAWYEAHSPGVRPEARWLHMKEG